MLKKSTWERHVNPWSVWTRVPLLPLFALVVLLRGPLGGWTWLLLAVLVGWTLVNQKPSRRQPRPTAGRRAACSASGSG